MHNAMKICERIGIAWFAFERVETHDDGASDHLAEQRFLVREVQVDGALGDASQSGDVLETRLLEAGRAEFRKRRFDDLRLALLGGPPGSRISLVGSLNQCD